MVVAKKNVNNHFQAELDSKGSFLKLFSPSNVAYSSQ